MTLIVQYIQITEEYCFKCTQTLYMTIIPYCKTIVTTTQKTIRPWFAKFMLTHARIHPTCKESSYASNHRMEVMFVWSLKNWHRYHNLKSSFDATFLTSPHFRSVTFANKLNNILLILMLWNNLELIVFLPMGYYDGMVCWKKCIVRIKYYYRVAPIVELSYWTYMNQNFEWNSAKRIQIILL
jgi:hypothetical protein